MDNLHAAVRAWAKGVYPLEAGAELLCRTRWARHLFEGGWVEVDEDGWLDGHRQAIAFPRVGAYLARAGYLSGGERRQLTIIASFLGQTELPIGERDHAFGSLYENLPGTDQEFVLLVSTAVLHAAGVHEQGGLVVWPDTLDTLR